jgi:shikimate kinase
MNIALYGFMGVGKSTVGKKLAEKLGYTFIDMDSEIEKQTGKTIKEIFQINGEPRFRHLESEMIKDLTKKDRLVIACGGGAIANEDNAKRLKASSRMVYLTASVNEIVSRTRGDGTRPLLNVTNPVEVASELYDKRRPIYSRYAEVEVDTTHKSIDVVVELILEKIN